MRRVFLDSSLNTTFLQKGYVVLDLLDSAESGEAIELYEKNHTEIRPETFFTTTHSFDLPYRQRCNEAITVFLKPYLGELLDDYLPLYGNFMVKPTGDKSECGLHQDWSFVDERNFRTVNVWVALTDTDLKNGCIHVIPGSQKLPFGVRGRNISRVYEEAITPMKDNLAEPLPLKKGQCVIFDSAILHYSPNNVSDHIRVAMSLILYPADAPLIHFSADRSDLSEIKKYNVDPEFFVKFSSAEEYFISAGESITKEKEMMGFDTIKSKLLEISNG